MQIQVLLRWARVAAIFADVKFIAPLFVRILLMHPVDLFKVGFQRTSLGKCLVADLTFVRTDSYTRPDDIVYY